MHGQEWEYADDRSATLASLQRLLAVADHALELQERAVAVLAACAAPEEPGPRVAREGAQIAGAFYGLWGRAVDSTSPAGLGSLERQLSELLIHHCQLLQDSVRSAFPRNRTPQTEKQRRAIPELGASVAELRSVRDDLDLWVTVWSPTG